MVMVDCRPEVEARYNDWYNNVHIPMLLKYEGMVRATRYQLLSGPAGQARYLTVYEFRDQEAMDAFPQTPECAAATAEMRTTWASGEFTIKLAARYALIGSYEGGKTTNQNG